MDSNIYTHTVQYAREHGELDAYRKNLRQNTVCAAALDAAVKGHHRDMQGALAEVRQEFGLDRPAWVLAGHLQQQSLDGRFSRTNTDWAKAFDIPPEQSSRIAFQTHPVYLDDLADAVRAELAARERGDVVQGYRILESTTFTDGRGFALAENQNAPDPFVTWQFTEAEDGKRDYFWGHYKHDADNARKDFHARVQEYHTDYGLQEKLPPAGYPCEHGYSARFAEKLMDGMEDSRQATLFSIDEKNLVCNYAFHTGDPTKTRQLAEELAAERFGVRHGFLNPAVAGRVNAEIAAIDERWARRDAASPIAAVEMSTEQNCNQIDGLRNNMATPPADLTDGQTHEEIRELAPETLSPEKPSVLGRIRMTRESSPYACSDNKAVKGKEECR